MINFLKSLVGGANNEQLKEAILDGALLIDVRTPQEFSEGSVKGAKNIPLDIVPNKIENFKNQHGVVLFCKSGGRCSQAKTFLEQQGIQGIYNGGSWQNVDSIVREIEQEEE